MATDADTEVERTTSKTEAEEATVMWAGVIRYLNLTDSFGAFYERKGSVYVVYIGRHDDVPAENGLADAWRAVARLRSHRRT